MNEIKLDETQHPPELAEATGQEQPNLFPVVGIGASAGGLRALQRFFAHTPTDTGMAFVIVTHLAPDRESHLSELLQPQTPMPVIQVTETIPVEPNHVYVMPPNHNLQSIDTHLRLTLLEAERRHRAPIDQFFRTLADTHTTQAICVILSGTGSDGALGLRRIKEVGGLTVVQAPGDADYDGMPHSAIATGDVELILPVEQIPSRLVEYMRSQPQVTVPQDGEILPEDERDLLQKILTQVRVHTGQDFARYKNTTLLRRIRRRMQVHNTAQLGDYLQLLRAGSGEVQALFHDFLITVTSFFRDPEAFDLLQQTIIPQLFQDKGAGDQVRVWTVGCATGEEAYSLAMLLAEQRQQLAAEGRAAPEIQIFASDLNSEGLLRAREGFFLESIGTDIALPRLERFFSKEPGGYRVRQELRELVLFTPHNILKDPPFSRIDLVACRNVLIYIERSAQQQVLELFHYALRPNGYLFLGPAETIEAAELFQIINKRHSFYQRRTPGATAVRLPTLPLLPSPPRPTPPASAVAQHSSGFEALHARLLEGFMPPSLLVNRDYNIVYFSANVGRYLQQPRGEPTNHLLDRVSAEIRIELTAALYRAFEKGETTHGWPISLKIEGEMRSLSLTVQPSPALELSGFVLVLFQESSELPAAAPALPANGEQSAGRALEAELAATKKRLQTVIEGYEISKEEMQAGNEELQSMNEELRSAAEELETSQEELQSVNEELNTINQENKNKIEELAQLTSDLQNLMAATHIATLFLDRDLRIKRFTPRVSELFNILDADRGRPLAHLTHKLGYPGLIDDVVSVLRTLLPIEREIRSQDGSWYLTRLLPYRTVNDRIDGVVITFVEISQRKAAEQQLRRSEERLQLAQTVTGFGSYDYNAQTGQLHGSAELRTLYGLAPDTPITLETIFELAQPDDRDYIRQVVQAALDRQGPGEFAAEYRTVRSDGAVRWIFSKGRTFFEDEGNQRHPVRLIGVAQDITERKQMQLADAYLAAIVRASGDAILGLSAEGIIESWNPAAQQLFGYTPSEAIGQASILLNAPAQHDEQLQMIALLRTGEASSMETVRIAKNGHRMDVIFKAAPVMDVADNVVGISVTLTDISARKTVEAEREQLLVELAAERTQLQALTRTLEQRVEERTATLNLKNQELTRFAFVASHDLKEPLRGIQNLAQWISEEAGQLPARSQAYLTKLQQRSKRLERLVDDLLVYVRIGRVAYNRERVEVAPLLQDIVELLAIPASFAVTITEPMPVLFTERAPLETIFLNLIGNAVKHHHQPAEGRMQISAQEQETMIEFTIADNGPGIDADQYERVFDIFQTLQPRDLVEGSGMGLSIVKKILENYGSAIRVESESGQGTVFRFTWPKG